MITNPSGIWIPNSARLVIISPKEAFFPPAIPISDRPTLRNGKMYVSVGIWQSIVGDKFVRRMCRGSMQFDGILTRGIKRRDQRPTPASAECSRLVGHKTSWKDNQVSLCIKDKEIS